MEFYSIKAQKIEALRNYKRVQLLYNLVLYSLTSFSTGFIFFYPFRFSSIRILILSLTQNIASYLHAKCFFFIGNLIILVLIRDSKLTQSSRSSTDSDFYHDYLARSRNHQVESQNHVSPTEKVDHAFVQSTNGKEKEDEVDNSFGQEKKSTLSVSVRMRHQEKKDTIQENKSEKEGQLCIPGEELNKRVEAFIARVNKQRLVEAKLVDRCRG